MSVDRSTERLASVLKSLCVTEWRETLVRWQIVGRWTRLYSEVQLIELQTSAATRCLIAKRAVRRPSNDVYHERGDVARREFEALRQAEASLASLPACRVPRVYRVVPTEDWLLMEYVAGAELDRQLAGARWLTPLDRQRVAEMHFERLGNWLQTYQRSTTTRIAATVLGETLSMAQRRLVGLADMPGISTDWVLQVTARLQGLLDQVASSIEASECHGDFGPWNVLVSPDHLTVIDFFCHRVDSIWIDPLNVVTYLQTQGPSISLSRRRVERLRDAFLHGYGRPLELDQPEYRFCLAYQQVCRLQDAVCTPRRSWADRYRRRTVVRELMRELTEGSRLRGSRSLIAT